MRFLDFGSSLARVTNGRTYRVDHDGSPNPRANVPRIAHSVHLGGSAHVGDANTDREAAVFHFASEFFGWAE